MDEYKPYQDWWKREMNLRDFILGLTFDMGLLENNLIINNKSMEVKTREEWMETLLLWMEYKK